MPWFRCFVRGENFPGVIIGEEGKFGFYATRWVEASSLEHAERAVVDFLRSDPTFELRDNSLGTEARVFVEDIDEVDVGRETVSNSGATWYPMDG